MEIHKVTEKFCQYIPNIYFSDFSQLRISCNIDRYIICRYI